MHPAGKQPQGRGKERGGGLSPSKTHPGRPRMGANASWQQSAMWPQGFYSWGGGGSPRPCMLQERPQRRCKTHVGAVATLAGQRGCWLYFFFLFFF